MSVFGYMEGSNRCGEIKYCDMKTFEMENGLNIYISVKFIRTHQNDIT